MALAEHESVAVRPLGLMGVMVHDLKIQSYHDIGGGTMPSDLI